MYGSTAATSSLIIEDIKTLCETRPFSGYAYYYFDRHGAQNNLYNNLIGSILLQISYRCNGVPAALQDLYHKHGDGREQPTLESLHSTLQQIIESFDDFYIVIDSLDECAELPKLLRSITGTRIWGSPSLHLLLTSRPQHDIQFSIQKIPHLQVVQMKNPASPSDIEMFLHARLAKIHRQWTAEIELIKNKLIEKADGKYACDHFPYLRIKLNQKLYSDGLTTQNFSSTSTRLLLRTNTELPQNLLHT